MKVKKEKKLRQKVFVIHILLLMILPITSICGQQTKTKGETNMKTVVVEMVIMKVKPGISDDDFVQGAMSINPSLSKFQGFISRELAKDESGNWIDIVHWTDIESAKKAAEQVLKSPTCGIWFEMIDEQSMKMYHYTTRHKFAK